jgi:hypothetical protein
MNKLLAFYLPKAAFEIMKFFLTAIAMVIAVKFLPIESSTKSAIVIGIMAFLFPLVSFFNNVMYLPASLDWILLTPIKKTHIILVHGLLNIFKIILMLSLVGIFLYFFESAVFTKLFLSSSDFDFAQIYTRVSVYDLMKWVLIIAFLGAFIFGVLPNYVQSMQQRQNYQVKKTTKELVKIYMAVIGFVLFWMMFVARTSDATSYIPVFIQVAMGFTFFTFALGFSTLKSVRFYFSKKKFEVVGLGVSILTAIFLYFYATFDIKSNKLFVANKIESLNFLGAYSNDLHKVIEKELLESGPHLEALTSYGLKDLFDGNTRKDMGIRVSENWEMICSQKYDFTCRLAYYMNNVEDKKTGLFQNVVKSCPNDIGSCFMVYRHKEVSDEERKVATETLLEKCKIIKSEYQEQICNSFKSSYMKLKK